MPLSKTRWPWRNAIVAALDRLTVEVGKQVTAIQDLQAADTSLQGTVATVLADFIAALQAAGSDPAAIESVVADMQTMQTQLQAADPGPPAAPPASG